MNSTTIDIREAQTKLFELAELVNSGLVVTITQARKPVMRLVPPSNGDTQRVAGLHAGMGWVSDDFDAPLPDEFWAGGL